MSEFGDAREEFPSSLFKFTVVPAGDQAGDQTMVAYNTLEKAWHAGSTREKNEDGVHPLSLLHSSFSCPCGLIGVCGRWS